MNDPFATPLSRRRALLSLGGACAGLAAWPALAWAGDSTAERQYALAKEFYHYAFPLAFFDRYRYMNTSTIEGNPNTGPQSLNTFHHFRDVPTTTQEGGPQVDCIYSMCWADLSAEPLLISIAPSDGRFWYFQCSDLMANNYALINRRNTKGPTTIALVGPKWQGKLPPQVARAHRASQPWSLLVMRTYVQSPADLANANRHQDGIVAAPLSHFADRASWKGEKRLFARPISRDEDPLADFRLIARMWRECPPPAADHDYLERFRELGFRPNAAPSIDELPQQLRLTLAKAAADGFQEIGAGVRRWPGEVTVNGWVKPNPETGLWRDRNYLFRAVVVQMGIVGPPINEDVTYGLQQSLDGKCLPPDATTGFFTYHALQYDPDGKPLSSDGRYELYMARDNMPEVTAFWSFTIYRGTKEYKSYLVPNALNRYSLGSKTPNLRFGPDGSLTFYLQMEDPGGDKSSNWLPVGLAGENFSIFSRAYESFGRTASLEWSGPVVRRVG